MHHWSYIVASYLIAGAGTIAMIWQAARSMREAERAVDRQEEERT